jgi:hypothetical protein
VAVVSDFSEETIADALERRATEAGATRVISVRLSEGEGNDGGPALFVTLSNPPGELGTWPVDDLWALRRIVGDALSQLGDDDARWAVRFEPKDAGELHPADAGDQVEV